MATTPIFKQLTTANQKKLSTEAGGGVRVLCVGGDGTVWSSQTSAGQNKAVHVYRHDSTGALVTTVELPYPKRQPKGAGIPPPAPHGLLLDGTTLWITDFQYGVVYKYSVPSTPVSTAQAAIFYESKAPVGEDKPVQYGAMALQKGGPVSAHDMLWVLDTQGKLAGFDLGASPTRVASAPAPTYTINLGVRTQSVQSLVFHTNSKTLWMVVEKTSGDLQLAALTVNAAPKDTDVKFFPLADAQALCLDEDNLYVGGKKGQLWKIPVGAIPPSLGSAATPIVTFSRPKDGQLINIFSISVDRSGYVWVTDENYAAAGNIYAISPYTPDGTSPQVVLEYQLIATPASAPATLAWYGIDKNGTLDEALYIADQEHNGQVIKISPLPALPPIKPDGTPAYTLAFTPQEAYAAPGESFGKPSGILLRAHPIATPAADLEVAVGLSVTNPEGVKVTLGGNVLRETIANDPHLQIKDLNVDASSGIGDSTLRAVGRGKPTGAKALFVGHVAAALQQISLKDAVGVTQRVAVQQGVFNIPNSDVTVAVSPSTAHANIKVTLSGPNPSTGTVQAGDVAHFNSDPKDLVATVAAGGKLPLVSAGKLAGSVTLTPSATPPATKSPSTTWLVIPVPATLTPPASPNFSPRDFGQSVAANQYKLTGYERLGDSKSKKVPTPGWKLRFTLSSVVDVKFKGTGASPDGRELIVTTNSQGIASIPNGAISSVRGQPVTNPFTVTAVWHTSLSGEGDSWVTTSEQYKTTFTPTTF